MTQSALNAPRLVSDTTEIDAIVTGGESLYRRRRKEMEEAEREYQAERFALLAGFDQKAQALIDEREDALRNLDTNHARRKGFHQHKQHGIRGYHGIAFKPDFELA